MQRNCASPDKSMRASTLEGGRRLRLPGCLRAEVGQALLETVLATAFLVAIALAINKIVGPVVLDAFEKIAKALASVGP